MPFLKRLLKELSEGPNYYNNCKYVIEGTHIDFEQLIPYINEKLQDKYFIIGLTFNKLTMLIVLYYLILVIHEYIHIVIIYNKKQNIVL